jgi:hypothetical protein
LNSSRNTVRFIAVTPSVAHPRFAFA